MSIVSINPSNKQTLGQVNVSTAEEVRLKVSKARLALKTWNEIGLAKRLEMLHLVAQGFEKRTEEFAELISKEMGMPIAQSRLDVIGAIDFFYWYLDNAEKYLLPEVVYEDKDMIHTVHYNPIGVVAAIAPWNFPASNFIWVAGQNLIIGNTVVFKDSEEVPLCGKFIEEVFDAANLPEGVFSEVYGDRTVGEALVNDDIDMICFTGSSSTGQQLYKVGADKFIKVFLELGGSAPGIVFEDVDIDKTLDTIYVNRFGNCGQICDGLKRLIVHENRFDEVLLKLKSKLQQVKVGDAIQETTDIGPLVSEKQLSILNSQIQDAVDKGAKLEYKKEVNKDLNGFFYSPTILTNVSTDMKVWSEEVFGPVLPIVTFKTEDEAIELANDTKYGLGGYIFTEDKNKFLRVAKSINTGMIQQNNLSYLSPASPFGGCKRSGLGRAHGKFGFYDLSEIKLVVEEKYK